MDAKPKTGVTAALREILAEGTPLSRLELSERLTLRGIQHNYYGMSGILCERARAGEIAHVGAFPVKYKLVPGYQRGVRKSATVALNRAERETFARPEKVAVSKKQLQRVVRLAHQHARDPRDVAAINALSEVMY